MSTCVAATTTNWQSSYERLTAHWEELCDEYLPVLSPLSIWRYSRSADAEDPAQGWKLHIPATVLTANEIMERVGAFLRREYALFKAPKSLDELSKLNSGLFYGYSQVGKFMTIYPKTNEQAVKFAKELPRLTRHLEGPEVPFDLRFRKTGCVYYRYGAFRSIGPADNKESPSIRDPNGNLVADLRNHSTAKPDWVTNPFSPEPVPERVDQPDNPLKTTFRVFRALTQRGKGGVYQAVDLSTAPPRLCVVKEGRKHGEVAWDARDGSTRVKYERHVLRALRECGVDVPLVYAHFEVQQNYYLVLEFIEGESLEKSLVRRKRRLSISVALKRAVEIASLVAEIHEAGWVWRDCKPGNIVITKRGELRPLDFEGACMLDRSDPLPWNTPLYTPPEADQPFKGQSRLPEDLYALGAVIYLLFGGRPPDLGEIVPLKKLRKNVPLEVMVIVNDLLHADPNLRPSAEDVKRRLLSFLSDDQQPL
jgi:class IV lanthipeptide synthase